MINLFSVQCDLNKSLFICEKKSMWLLDVVNIWMADNQSSVRNKLCIIEQLEDLN